MELRQIEYFLTVCKKNGFTRAAEHLHISQPSITTAIKKLEEELGTKLFDRTHKLVELTPEGEFFYEKAKEIMLNKESLITEIKDFAEARKGKIKLGMLPMIASYIFPQIFIGFKKEYPSLTLHISEENTNSLINGIKEGAINIGFGILNNITDDCLETMPLGQTQVCACFSQNHALSKNNRIELEEVKSEPLIMLKEGFFLRNLMPKYFSQNNFKPNIILSSSHFETIKNLVSHNIGISFLYDLVIANKNNVVGIPLSDPIYVTNGLMWHKDRYLSKATKSFIDFCSSMNKRY